MLIFAKLVMAICVIVFTWRQISNWQRLMHQPVASKRQAEFATLEFVRLGYIPSDRLRLIHLDAPEQTGELIMKAEIMAVDHGDSTFILAAGDDVPQTDFRVESIHPPKMVSATRAIPAKVVLANKRSGEKVELMFRKMVDVRGSSAVLRYNGEMPGGGRMADFTVRVGEAFMLPPENGKTYRVLNIKGRGAVVEFPDGTKRLITEK